MNNYYYGNYRSMRNNNMYPFQIPNNFQNQNLFSPKEGFERGNLFANLYSEYKNYKPIPITPKNEQEKRLLEIQTLSFAAHELNLYLDLHPEDESMVRLFNDYRRQKEELVKKYEEDYGPLTVGSESMEDTTYKWINAPWPWEVGNV